MGHEPDQSSVRRYDGDMANAVAVQEAPRRRERIVGDERDHRCAHQLGDARADRRPRRRGGDLEAERALELVERAVQMTAELARVGDETRIRDGADRQAVGVAHDRELDPHAVEERHERMDLVDAAPEHPARLARAGDVGRDGVERGRRWHEPAEERVQRRGKHAGELEREPRRPRLALVLQRTHLRRDPPEPLFRIGDVDRQPGDHRGDEVPERHVLLDAADAHGDERAHAEAVGRHAARAEPSTERAAHDGQHDVVHLAVGGAARHQEVVERERCPHDPPAVADRRVERQRRAGVAYERGERADRLHRVARLLEQGRRAEPRARRPTVRSRRRACASIRHGARHRIGHGFEQLRPAHAVDHGVVDLAEQRGTPTGEAVDQVRLPERSIGIERRREERVEEPVQRLVVAGRRHGDVADVPSHVEARVVLPVRPFEVEEGSHRSLAVAGDATEPLGHRGDERLERDRSFEQRDAADVESLVRLLVVEERSVERRESMRGCHALSDAIHSPSRVRVVSSEPSGGSEKPHDAAPIVGTATRRGAGRSEGEASDYDACRSQ